METLKYLGSTLADDGELDAEVTHRVQSRRKNWKRVSGMLSDREMNVKRSKEKLYDSSKTSIAVRGEDIDGNVGTGKEVGCRINANATNDVQLKKFDRIYKTIRTQKLPKS